MKLSSMLLSVLVGVTLVGCAKDVEPEASPGKETESGATEPAEKAELKIAPEEGDDVAILDTEKGRIVVMFYPERAPNHVANFKELVESGFYDGTRFHRCMNDFMIQGGDPQSKDLNLADRWGTGGNVVNGAEKQLALEPSEIRHLRGVLSMARGPAEDSASSQFFLMHGNSAQLDGQYSAFGKIVSGIAVVDEIVKTGSPNPNDNGKVEPSEAIVLKKATLAKWPVEGVEMDPELADRVKQAQEGE